MAGIKNFNDWPVKKKLSFIVLITSGVLIAVMVVAVTVEKTVSYRAKALNSSKVLAAIIGENSTAALSFRDEVTAKEILSALKAEKDILEAALYSNNGTIFSHYVHSGHWSTDSNLWFSKIYAKTKLKADITFNAPWFTNVHDIQLGNKIIGHIVLRVDLSSLNKQLQYFTVFMTSFSLLLLALASFVCMRLNQAVLGPVSQLAETMSKVSETQNYEASVSKRYDDEIGILVDGFNNMLVGIRKRDDELADYRNDLQNLVRERTTELEITNEQLKNEIEERKEVQKRLVHAQKMEAIGTLAGGVAHDLNNILSGVVTYPDLLLLQIPPNSSFVQPLETIRDSGRRAAAIVQDLLTLARRGVKVEDKFDFQDLIVQYLGSLEFKELQKDHPDVTVNFTVQETRYFVKGSSVHLSKTIMNLISNGMEAIEGKGDIYIQLDRIHLDSQPVNFDKWRVGNYVELKVRDTGIGIASEYQERIFEPFFSHKVMGKSGTGLGMSVVWGTVEDHNGVISVDSSVGAGTTFQLLFPLIEEPLETREKQLEQLHKKGNGETVLVVDDSGEQRLIAADILRHLGYKVITLSSGEGAMDFLRNNSVDLLILDMVMEPGINGLETFRRILKFKPGQKAVIASGFSQQESIEEARAIGVADFIVKPYSVERIGESLHKVLEEM
ncbi:MAG: two-component system cell cycle sensor histidine kinase/response regulator CckA [Desulforhopalus sp.]|jgi:two-component system cell cycle sensor histidine kinase/response regulator CckA